MKKLIKFAFVLVALLVVGVVALFFFIDTLARKGIEEGGTYALGTTTTLTKADVGVLNGSFSLEGLKVANPSGAAFTSPSFLSLTSGGVSVSLASLRGSTVELPNFSLDGLTVNLEKKDSQTNYKIILANLEKLAGGGAGGTGGGGPAPSSSKRFVVRDLSITNVSINVDLLGFSIPGSPGSTNIVIPIDTIQLTDVGQTGDGVSGSGVTISELAGIIVNAVLSAASANGKGIIPDDILSDLNGSLSQLQSKLGGQLDLQAMGMKIGDKAIGDAQKAVEGAVDEATNKVEDALKDATKGIEGLIPGKKK